MNGVQMLENAEHYVAIDNVCAWPNLVVLGSGEIVAAVYNKPSHGFGCGDVDLYVSGDGGLLWQRRSAVSDHSDQPEVVRMNEAVGLNAKGELVALVSGWSKGRERPFLPTQVCISGDGGRTWGRTIWQQEIPDRKIPFGPIVPGPDGLLTAGVYEYDQAIGLFTAYTIRSADDGRTWGDLRLLGKGFNETWITRLRDGSFLAAGRTPQGGADLSICASERLMLLRSPDGRAWEVEPNPLTVQGQHPGHILELHDGRLLLTYGSRITGLYGVGARMSTDKGKTWSAPKVLVAAPGPMDCGYPSSVELPDGKVLTAYYAGPAYYVGEGRRVACAMPWHRRHHMAVLRWRAEGFDA